MAASAQASAAARNSSGAEIVSTQSTSAPPAFSPSACSWKISTASAWVSAPIGSMISPVGPIEPATITARPARSTTSRPSAAATRLSSATRPCAPWSLRRAAFAPKLFVRKRSEPASTAPA
jgi:hypothetical protein